MDPEDVGDDMPALHDAVRFAPFSTVRELIRESSDIDTVWWGRTALWEAVQERRDDVALALVQAGADPWRSMIAGWSPGRLNLAGPAPDLFGAPPVGVALSSQEQAAVDERRRLIGALGTSDPNGQSFACIADVDVTEAGRRLGATPIDDVDTELLLSEPWETGLDDDELNVIVGVSDVPGGCIVGQWWMFAPSAPGVMAKLTPGTIGYGIYGNPKSGNQGRSFRDGVMVDWDQHPGGGDAAPDDSPEETLRTYLYRKHAVAYCCNYAGLRPQDPRAFTGPPDRWLRLPPLDLWPAG